jgi:hypothetical protein
MSEFKEWLLVEDDRARKGRALLEAVNLMLGFLKEDDEYDTSRNPASIIGTGYGMAQSSIRAARDRKLQDELDAFKFPDVVGAEDETPQDDAKSQNDEPPQEEPDPAYEDDGIDVDTKERIRNNLLLMRWAAVGRRADTVERLKEMDAQHRTSPSFDLETAVKPLVQLGYLKQKKLDSFYSDMAGIQERDSMISSALQLAAQETGNDLPPGIEKISDAKLRAAEADLGEIIDKKFKPILQRKTKMRNVGKDKVGHFAHDVDDLTSQLYISMNKIMTKRPWVGGKLMPWFSGEGKLSSFGSVFSDEENPELLDTITGYVTAAAANASRDMYADQGRHSGNTGLRSYNVKLRKGRENKSVQVVAANIKLAKAVAQRQNKDWEVVDVKLYKRESSLISKKSRIINKDRDEGNYSLYRKYLDSVGKGQEASFGTPSDADDKLRLEIIKAIVDLLKYTRKAQEFLSLDPNKIGSTLLAYKDRFLSSSLQTIHASTLEGDPDDGGDSGGISDLLAHSSQSDDQISAPESGFDRPAQQRLVSAEEMAKIHKAMEMAFRAMSSGLPRERRQATLICLKFSDEATAASCLTSGVPQKMAAFFQRMITQRQSNAERDNAWFKDTDRFAIPCLNLMASSGLKDDELHQRAVKLGMMNKHGEPLGIRTVNQEALVGLGRLCELFMQFYKI